MAVLAPWASPLEVYNYAIGKSIDTDNYPARQKYQCFDFFADFCIKLGLKVNLLCSITGYAGDLYKLRYNKGYDKYFEFFYPKNAKRGDWIFWDQHVAMVWEVKGDKVLCLGQNQGGAPYVNLKWYNLNSALGCMRWKGWIEKMTGWVKSGTKWYYFDKDGNKLTGWQFLKWSKGENWFYFDKEGAMLTGWHQLKWGGGTSWFYFDSNGAMLTGLRKLPWKGQYDYYYLDPKTGAMKTGIVSMKLTFDKNGCLIGGQKV